MTRYTLHILRHDRQSMAQQVVADGPPPVVPIPAPIKEYLTAQYGDRWTLSPGWTVAPDGAGMDCWIVKVVAEGGCKTEVGMIEYEAIAKEAP